MKVRTLALMTTALLLNACAKSPTGRNQFLMFGEEKMAQMGSESFAQLKSDMKKTQAISHDVATNAYVQCISDHIIAQLPQKYASQNWEVVVFLSDQVNAFALPGGKIGVYTGLMKVAKNQDQLAAVVGHEVGHVIAQHGNERVSSSTAVNVGLQATNVALDAASVQYRGAIMQGLGLGAQFGVLMPYGRTHESEADEIGQELMAKAGFNPKQSVALWQEMSKNSGEQPPEFMSTHPSHQTRIKDLQSRMSGMTALYNTARAQGRIPKCKVPAKLPPVPEVEVVEQG